MSLTIQGYANERKIYIPIKKKLLFIKYLKSNKVRKHKKNKLL